MIAGAVIHNPTVTHYFKFIETTVGIDKLLRTLQYFSRFCAWYLHRRNGTVASVAPFEAIKKQFGLARKLIGTGRNVKHFVAAATFMDTKEVNPVLKYLAVGRHLSYGLYLTLDVFTYLDAAQIKPNPAAKKLCEEAYKAWITALAFSAVSGVYSLYRLGERETMISKEDGEGALQYKTVQKERAAINLQLLSDLCDLTIASSALGWANLDDGIIGLTGIVSSLIGVYRQWKKTA